MIDRDESWWAGLCLWCVDTIGSARHAALMQAFGSATAAWQAGPKEWATALDRPKLAEMMAAGCLPRGEVADWLSRTGSTAIRRDDPEYPERLAGLGEPPWLFVRGSTKALSAPLAGVVGTRAVSSEGVRLTEQVVRWCLERGYATCSGGALGVDTAVHRATVAGGRPTVVVLPAGFGHLAPASNAPLFDSVCAAGGCLVSEVPPWRPARAQLFARRNRLISGLSVLTIVVRAPRRSGALITADWARRQGRPLFAVPGAPGDPTAAGCIELIRRGAGMLGAAEDLPWAGAAEPAQPMGGCVTTHQGVGTEAVPEDVDLGARSRALLAEMWQGAAELEELVGRLQWTPAEVMGELTRLLLAGRIQQLGAGRYRPQQTFRSP